MAQLNITSNQDEILQLLSADREDAPGRDASLLPDIEPHRAAESGVEAAFRRHRIFPNEASLIRLMGSVLIEQNSISQARKAIFSKESYQGLLKSDVRNQLHLIAEEQAALLAA